MKRDGETQTGFALRLIREEVWDAAIHHVEAHLDGKIKRAAMLDNPYRDEAK